MLIAHILITQYKWYAYSSHSDNAQKWYAYSSHYDNAVEMVCL